MKCYEHLPLGSQLKLTRDLLRHMITWDDSLGLLWERRLIGCLDAHRAIGFGTCASFGKGKGRTKSMLKIQHIGFHTFWAVNHHRQPDRNQHSLEAVLHRGLLIPSPFFPSRI